MNFLDNQLDAAEASFTRSWTIYRDVYAGKHCRVGVALGNLGSVLLAKKALTEAARSFREAIAHYKELLSSRASHAVSEKA